MGWDYPAQYTYGLAGSFGAFVNRRYGTSIVTGTIECAGVGIDCLDGLIRAGGGTGFADEFESCPEAPPSSSSSSSLHR